MSVARIRYRLVCDDDLASGRLFRATDATRGHPVAAGEK
jgi:hypothetical protein